MNKVYALLFILAIVVTQSTAKYHKKSKNITLVKYKLKVGDRLPSIAKRYNTTVSKIVQVNKLDMSKRLKIGKVLKVPTNIYKLKQITGIDRRKMDPDSKCLAYSVKKGDTLSALAKRAHTTVAEIAMINRFHVRTKKLRLGETIVIPIDTKKRKPTSRIVVKAKKKSGSVPNTQRISSKTSKRKVQNRTHQNFYTIRRGDTLYELALENNTTVSRIKQLNRISKNRKLKIGQKILLVDSVEVHPHSKIRYSRLVKKIFNMQEEDIQESRKKDLEKIASHTDITVKFSKRIEKYPVQNEEIYSHLDLGNSPVKLSLARKHLGKRYVWGANGPKTFDCSGFTKYVCNQSGISLPRTSINQSKVGKRVNRGSLKAGDLIFFDTSRRHRGYVNHVGIYIGNNKFIHASSGKKRVVIASLNKPFYKARFKWGSRIKS